MKPECFNFSSNSLPLDDTEIFSDNDDTNLLSTDEDSNDDTLHLELSVLSQNSQRDQTPSPVVHNVKNGLNLTYRVSKDFNSQFSSPHNKNSHQEEFISSQNEIPLDESVNLEETTRFNENNLQNNSAEEQNLSNSDKSSLDFEEIKTDRPNKKIAVVCVLEEFYSQNGDNAQKLSLPKDNCSHLDEINDEFEPNLSNHDDTSLTRDESFSTSVNTSVNCINDEETTENDKELAEKPGDGEETTKNAISEIERELEQNGEELVEKSGDQKGKKGRNKPTAKLKSIEVTSKSKHSYNTRSRIKKMDDKQVDSDGTVNSGITDDLVKSVQNGTKKKKAEELEVKINVIKLPTQKKGGKYETPKKDLKNVEINVIKLPIQKKGGKYETPKKDLKNVEINLIKLPIQKKEGKLETLKKDLKNDENIPVRRSERIRNKSTPRK